MANPLTPEVLKGENQDPMAQLLVKLFVDLDLNLPVLDPNANFIRRKLYKWEMADRAEISTHKMTIATNNAAILKANIELIGMAMNIPLLLKAFTHQIEDDHTDRQIKQQADMITNQIKQQEFNRVSFDNERARKAFNGTPTT